MVFNVVKSETVLLISRIEIKSFERDPRDEEARRRLKNDAFKVAPTGNKRRHLTRPSR